MYVLCDLAREVALAMVARDLGTLPTADAFPGSIPLPRALYRQLAQPHASAASLQQQRAQPGRNYLPAGYQVQLQPKQEVAAPPASQQQQGQGQAAQRKAAPARCARRICRME